MSSQKSLAQLSAEKFFDPIAQAAFNAGYAQLPEAMKTRLLNLQGNDRDALVVIVISDLVHPAYRLSSIDIIPISSSLRLIAGKQQAAILRQAECIRQSRREEEARRQRQLANAMVDRMAMMTPDAGPASFTGRSSSYRQKQPQRGSTRGWNDRGRGGRAG